MYLVWWGRYAYIHRYIHVLIHISIPPLLCRLDILCSQRVILCLSCRFFCVVYNLVPYHFLLSDLAFIVTWTHTVNLLLFIVHSVRVCWCLFAKKKVDETFKFSFILCMIQLYFQFISLGKKILVMKCGVLLPHIIETYFILALIQ